MSGLNVSGLDPAWCLDSGATAHITNDPGKMVDCNVYTGSGTGNVGNGQHVPISHTGTTSLHTTSGNLLLHDLLIVSDMHKNLVPVSKFAQDNNVYFEFYPRCCYVKDLVSHKVLIQGTETGGLYKFLPTSSVLVFNTIHTVVDSSDGSCQHGDEFAIWHQRLGHPSSAVVSQVLKSCNVRISKPNSGSFCRACELGKSHKLSLSSSLTIYTAPLELVVADLRGPASCYSSRSQYYLSFVDTFSRHTWLYFLKHKSDAFQVFLSFKSHVEL